MNQVREAIKKQVESAVSDFKSFTLEQTNPFQRQVKSLRQILKEAMERITGIYWEAENRDERQYVKQARIEIANELFEKPKFNSVSPMPTKFLRPKKYNPLGGKKHRRQNSKMLVERVR